MLKSQVMIYKFYLEKLSNFKLFLRVNDEIFLHLLYILYLYTLLLHLVVHT